VCVVCARFVCGVVCVCGCCECLCGVFMCVNDEYFWCTCGMLRVCDVCVCVLCVWYFYVCGVCRVCDVCVV